MPPKTHGVLPFRPRVSFPPSPHSHLKTPPRPQSSSTDLQSSTPILHSSEWHTPPASEDINLNPPQPPETETLSLYPRALQHGHSATRPPSPPQPHPSFLVTELLTTNDRLRREREQWCVQFSRLQERNDDLERQLAAVNKAHEEAKRQRDELRRQRDEAVAHREEILKDENCGGKAEGEPGRDG